MAKIKEEKIVCFDFDGTCTKGESAWGVIFRERFEKEVDSSDKKSLNMLKNLIVLSANEFLRLSMLSRLFVKLLNKYNINKELIDRVGKSIQLADNFHETINTLKQNGYDLVIISGGIRNAIVTALGEDAKYFSAIYGSNIEFDKNGKVIKFEAAEYDNSGKAIMVNAIMQKHGISKENMYFVGDGINDLSVTKLGINTIGVNINNAAKRNMKWGKMIANVKCDFGKILSYIPIDREKE